MEVSSLGIVQAERLKTPFFRLVGVLASSYMATFEANAHLININVLIRNEVPTKTKTEMLCERSHTPERILYLLCFLLLDGKFEWINDMKSRFQDLKTISRETLFYKGIRVAGVLTPV